MAETYADLNARGLECYKAEEYSAAVSFFEEAVRLGSLDAYYNLAICYMNGQGTTKNYMKAIELFADYADEEGTPAADAGAAACNMGFMFEQGGYGIRSDWDKALQLYAESSDMGCAHGMLNYGRMLQLKNRNHEARQYIRLAMDTAPNDKDLQKKAKSLLVLNWINRW